MANLTETPEYTTGIFQLELDTPVKGGAPVIAGGVPTDGHSNAQALQLANRTAYLKQQADAVVTQIDDAITALQGEVDPFPQYALEADLASVVNGPASSVDSEVALFDGTTGKLLKGGGVLGSAAFTQDTDYATAAQGALADTAVQPATLDDYELLLTAGMNITIDRTDPLNPVINASITGGGGGDVVGPASSVNNAVALFDGTTGKLLKDGGVLGSAAFTASTDYATAAQGALADTATQPGDLATVATTGAYSDLSGLPTLGTAAAADTTDFASAAQGALADTALQPEDIGTSVQELLVSGTNIKTLNGESLLGSTDIVVVTLTGTESLTNKTVSGPRFSTAQYIDYTVTNATATGAVTLDLSLGNIFDLTLTGNTTLSITNAPTLSGETHSFTVRVRQGATAYSLTWFSGITWLAASTPDTPAENKIAEFTFSTTNGTAFLGGKGRSN